MKVGDSVTAERWCRTVDVRWKRIAKVGEEPLPCMVACVDRDESELAEAYQGGRYWKEARGAGFAVEKTVTVGDRVAIGRFTWEVVERVVLL